MTEAQWHDIQGDLAAIKILLFSLAKTSHNFAGLHAVFQGQQELLDTALLNSQAPDIAIQIAQKKLSEIEKMLWG